jgi:hypothetical protein
MKKLFLLFLLAAPGLVLAQAAPEPAASDLVGFVPPSVQASDPTGNIACFDYYKFGSVQADLQTNLAETVPGATLGFVGSITNANDYPLVDGKLIAKIFRRSEVTFKEGNGNEIVDQIIIAQDVNLAAQGKKEASFEWKVPVNARGGEYYAAYFFVTSGRYNLMGLSFTDDVVGNQAPFKVKNDQDPKIAFLLKNGATVNGKEHHFAAFPLQVTAEEAVTTTVKVQNPSNQTKTLPVQWNQYGWDSAREENRQNTKTELVTLQPNETKEISYKVLPTASSVVFVTVVTQDGESKSLLNIRYVRTGVEETRINFPGLTQFPIKAGQEQTLFACAHSTNSPVVKDNILVLTLKDREGQIISQYRYEGDIAGAMSGFGDKFRPKKDYDYVTLEASLFRGGSEMEKVEIVYDCQAIDPTTCSTNAGNSGGFFTGKKLAVVAIALVGIVVLGAGVLVLRRRKREVNW